MEDKIFIHKNSKGVISFERVIFPRPDEKKLLFLIPLNTKTLLKTIFYELSLNHLQRTTAK